MFDEYSLDDGKDNHFITHLFINGHFFWPCCELGFTWRRYCSTQVTDDCLYFEQQLGMKRPSHQMLGYPVYTQAEARRNIDAYDTLLFQLDSQFSKSDNRELVMWGDMGSGFIFMNQGDMMACDFSHPYYCWDCG